MPAMTTDEARMKCHVIKVHAPTLDDKLCPKFKLVNMECPLGKDGQCSSCANFKGVDLAPTGGRIFSYQLFEGFCAKESECETCAVCGGDDASCSHCNTCGAPMCASCTDAGEDCPCDGDPENLEVELPDEDRSEFADPGGRSALRAATPDNPRIFACPTCGAENRLTGLDVQRGYQCDTCADKAEAGVP